MSEEKKYSEEVAGRSFLDVFGGPEDHSREEEGELKPGEGEEDAPLDFGEEEDGFTDGKSDSAKAEGDGAPENDPPPPGKDDVENARLKQEVTTLTKRLHDTQSAMHRATQERSDIARDRDGMARELEALRKKRDSDEWFTADDAERVSRLESGLAEKDKTLKQSDEKLGELTEQAKRDSRDSAEAIWEEAAAPVKAAHPDFEDVVYGKLAPLIDAEKGDPMVRAMWEKETDKSPANAYKFARKALDLIEMATDPEAYKARLLKESQQNNNQPTAPEDQVPRGKAGLDMLNSGGGAPPESGGGGGGSFVDDVFK